MTGERARELIEGVERQFTSAIKERDALRAEVATLRAERDRLKMALEEIQQQDPVELALDPQWSQRIAVAALNQERES